ncbi:hypothetical protein AgCh_002340 [Apium graveolens]
MSSAPKSIGENLNPNSVQKLVTCCCKKQLTSSIPREYAYFKKPSDSTALPGDGIPVIDYSLLNSEDPVQRAECVRELGKACRDWGAFLVKKHGISEKLHEKMLEKCEEFNSMSDEEKQKLKMKKDVMDMMMFGSSINVSTEARFWRDYLKLFVHPDFNSPKKPQGFRETLLEISTKQRQVMKKLFSGVSKSLEPELAVGLSPHTDFGLLSILTSNGVGGLQIQQNGTWFNVDIPPHYLMVNHSDHMEILTNGKYKSVVHRVVVNYKTTWISMVTFYGLDENKFVVPTSTFVQDENNPSAYRGTTYLQ